MDYRMMPPPPSTSCAGSVAAAGGAAGDFGGPGGVSHYSSDSPQNQLFTNEQQQSQNGNQFTATQYKPHFSGRAHVNRPPPLSLNQTYYRDTLTQSPAHTPQHYHTEHQPSPHCIPASPHHTQSPLVTHSPHIDQSPRPVPQSPHHPQNAHVLHRQSSAQHLVQSPHISQSPHHFTGGEMSPRPSTAHLQQNLYTTDRTHSPLPYDSISSPIHPHKHRHFSDSTSQSPHPYNVHSSASAVAMYNNAPIPSPHHYTADPSPSPHHFNDPNPSPFNDPGPHRSSYLDSSQPGTPAAAGYSHPGTPAGYVDSPHQHASPHPARSAAYQHFFGPNVPLSLLVNGGGNNVGVADGSSLDIANNGAQFPQQSQHSTDNSQLQSGANAAMLHSNPGGQGDAMLSAINITAQESESAGLQDSQCGHTETAMDTDWVAVPQKLKSSSSAASSFNLFDNGGNPPGVDELLSHATDFIANSNTLSLSDVPKEATKMKPRPKGRPSKNSMSPRSYGAQCPICGKTFNNSSALAKHKLTHSDERKYVCQSCSKAFKRQDHLNGHMMTHRTKKPFECSFDGCTKSYCDARSLRRHLENHHNVPSDSLFDISLNNYGPNGGGMYPGFHGDPSTPSPHASPSYPNVPGQQFFRFEQGGHLSNPGDQPYMFNDAPQPAAECTICHKRFKNLPALNGHMRLHGGYVNVKKPESGGDSKSNKSDSALTPDGGGSKKNLSRLQHSGGSKVAFSSSSSTSRDGSRDGTLPAHNLMVLNNKYSMEHSSVPGDDSASQSNLNQNNNQGNVRQGGDGLLSLAPNFLGGGLHLNTQTPSEPPMFPLNPLSAASQFPFTSMDQLMLLAQQQQLQRQMQGGAPNAPTFPALPMMPVNPAHSLPDQLLFEAASRARADSFHSGIFLNSPATSKISDLSLDSNSRVITPVKDREISASLHLHDQQVLGVDSELEDRKSAAYHHPQILDQDDDEVSQIIGGEHALAKENFLAERKRHASAPEQLADSKSWHKQSNDQQQQLNEEYAKAQELSLLPTTGHRRRRSSADNHRLQDFKQPHSYSLSSGDLLTRSDGAMLFRSPPPGGVKKRKHRPEPLVIRPNLAAVQSRLRSPRTWEPGENHGVRHTGKTPPPYTPPPILSPMRSGTGLFCGMYWRQNSASGTLSASLPNTKLGQLKQQMSIPEEPALVIEEPKLEPMEPVVEEQVEYVEPEPVVDTEPVPPPLETDIKPHINVGSDHQVELPALRKNRRDAERDDERATLLWTPECLDHSLTVQELTAYMDFSCSAAVPGSGSNKEYALHQLYFNKGDIKRSILCLMSKKISPSFVKFIGDYHYQDSDVWTTEEIQLYTDSIMKEDKDFISITKAFDKKKSHKQCVEFYYFWKKICPDEYKRLRILRRKRRNDELYNLRSRQKGAAAVTHSDDEDSISQVSDSGEADDEDMVSDAPSSISSVPHSRTVATHLPPHVTYPCEYPGCTAVFNSKPALNGHGKIHVLPRAAHNVVRERSSPAPKKIKTEPVPPAPGSEEFPCKLCGKVFYKVKSRSAHMKSHSVLAKKARDAANQAKQQQQQQQQHMPS